MTNDQVIDIEDLTITSPAVFEVTIRGSDAILFNKMPDLSKSTSKGEKQTKEDKLEIEKRTWKEKAYVNEDGGLYIPGENIHECMIQGSAYWGQKIPGEGNKRYTDVIKSGAIVEDVALDQTIEDLIPMGRAVNGTPNARKPAKVYKIRPMLRPWSGKFRIHVFDGRIDQAILRTVISYAGIYRGLCDWRPIYGRFELVKIEKVA